MILGIDLDGTIIDDFGTHYQLKKDAEKYLPMLYNRGYELHLITARNVRQWQYVLKIVEEIEDILRIRFSSIVCTSGDKKGYYANRRGCKYMIDNDPFFLEDCHIYNIIPILIGTDFIDNNQYKNWKHIYDNIF